MELTERKLKILQAIISDYVKTAEPVGSRTISKKYDLGISPATIRNEMADLEEMGYLTHPHTSAGRVPSDMAYRLYVNALMEKRELSKEEKNVMLIGGGIGVAPLRYLPKYYKDIKFSYLDYDFDSDTIEKYKVEKILPIFIVLKIILRLKE